MEIKKHHPEVFQDIKEVLKDSIEYGDFNIEEDIDEYYNSESNHKHADLSDPRLCFEYDEIETAFNEAYNEMTVRIKNV